MLALALAGECWVLGAGARAGLGWVGRCWLLASVLGSASTR